MQVTIVTPSFNSATYLRECLSSVKSTYELNHLVIDGGSTDATLDQLVRAPKTSSIQWISRKDSGPAQAINEGFSAANTEIIGWLNSDDCYASGAIDRAVKAFKMNPKLVMVYGLGRHVDESGKRLGLYPTLPPNVNIKHFSNGSFICQPTVFIRRNILEKVGLLDESLKAAFDFDFWLRIFKAYPRSRIGFINKVQAYSRLHDQCITQRLRQTIALEGMQIVTKHFGSAPLHWALTHIDELCASFPFENARDYEETLVNRVKIFLSKAKLFIQPDQFKTLVNELEQDYRLRLSNVGVFAEVQPDGWVSNRLVVRLTYMKESKRIVRLQCRGGWPKIKSGQRPSLLKLLIRLPDGSSQQIQLDPRENFVINLEAPETNARANFAWVIETTQSFVPSKVIGGSKDDRKLSFRVEALRLI
jgi:glycosyltransferase involved in cell wall biosynthesis